MHRRKAPVNHNRQTGGRIEFAERRFHQDGHRRRRSEGAAWRPADDREVSSADGAVGLSRAGSSGGSSESRKGGMAGLHDRVRSLRGCQWQDSAGYSVFPLASSCGVLGSLVHCGRAGGGCQSSGVYRCSPSDSRVHAGDDDGVSRSIGSEVERLRPGMRVRFELRDDAARGISDRSR